MHLGRQRECKNIHPGLNLARVQKDSWGRRGWMEGIGKSDDDFSIERIIFSTVDDGAKVGGPFCDQIERSTRGVCLRS